jgi:hypothetical protein
MQAYVFIQVRLEGCTFTDNQAEHILTASHAEGFNTAEFFSDQEMPVFLPDWHRYQSTKMLVQAPAGLFLTGSEDWLAELRTVSALAFENASWLAELV